MNNNNDDDDGDGGDDIANEKKRESFLVLMMMTMMMIVVESNICSQKSDCNMQILVEIYVSYATTLFDIILFHSCCRASSFSCDTLIFCAMSYLK